MFGSGGQYVLLGASYMLSKPSLWKMVVCPLIICMLVGLILLIVMLAAVFPPQARALEDAGLQSGWAWFLSFFLTLIEAGLIGMIVFLIVYGQLQQQIFDKVYEDKAGEAARQNMATVKDTCCSCCKGCGYFMILNIVLTLFTAWLNIIPILGTMAYAWLTGFYYAWGLHTDYFTNHGVPSLKDQFHLAKARSFYTEFGTAAVFMETIPLVGIYFVFSNAVGAALYAAKEEPALKFLESKRLAQQQSNPNSLQNTNGTASNSARREVELSRENSNLNQV